jgi:hypothetical protein
MRWMHIGIAIAAFGMISAGWWIGKVDSSVYIPLATGAIAGTLWLSNKSPAAPAPPAAGPK